MYFPIGGPRRPDAGAGGHQLEGRLPPRQRRGPLPGGAHRSRRGGRPFFDPPGEGDGLRHPWGGGPGPAESQRRGLPLQLPPLSPGGAGQGAGHPWGFPSRALLLRAGAG